MNWPGPLSSPANESLIVLRNEGVPCLSRGGNNPRMHSSHRRNHRIRRNGSHGSRNHGSHHNGSPRPLWVGEKFSFGASAAGAVEAAAPPASEKVKPAAPNAGTAALATRFRFEACFTDIVASPPNLK